MTDLLQLARNAGFTHAAPLNIAAINLKPEVRQMCADNLCGKYAKSWSCPPGCGELDVLRAQLRQYTRGILVQTVGQLEDSFDAEGMMAAKEAHQANQLLLEALLRPRYPRLRAMGAGCCTVCKTCTYPDNPCRFPEKQHISMEAYGMLVTEVCRQNGLAYHHGTATVTYTGCFLLE